MRSVTEELVFRVILREKVQHIFVIRSVPEEQYRR